MKTILLILILLFISLASCNQFGYGLWPEGDPHWNPVTNDTIPVTPEPLFNDSCQSFEQQISPVFFTMEVHTDLAFDHWVYHNSHAQDSTINIDTFFAKYGGISRTYYSGVNIGGVIDGILKKQAFGNIFAIDINGGRYQAFKKDDSNRALANYGWIFGGALTFDQNWSELQNHPSVQIVNFRNSGYTLEQIEQILTFFVENCKAGPDIVDLRPISIGNFVINPDIIAALILSGSNVWQ